MKKNCMVCNNLINKQENNTQMFGNFIKLSLVAALAALIGTTKK